MADTPAKGLLNRILQMIARSAPGARTIRVACHRMRGVSIGKHVWIGYDSILETAYPHLITIGNNVGISMRVIMVAHFKESRGITIGDDVFIGPGAIILPGVKIGDGAVVTAGSVVSSSVAPKTMVQGNPAQPVAKCGSAMTADISMKQFLRDLKPLRKPKPKSN